MEFCGIGRLSTRGTPQGIRWKQLQVMSTPLRALLVEDSEQDAFLLAEALRQRGFEPTIVRVETAAGMRAALLGQDWDIVLCDFLMPQFDAFKALDVLRETGREIPLVVVSGMIGEETAVELLTRGAADYLLKDRLARLGPAVSRILEQQALRRIQRRTEETLRFQAQMLDCIGQAVIATDPAGKILYANRFATQLYGWSREEILGRNIMETTVEETSRAEAEAIMRQLSSGASWTGEFLVRRHDGGVFPAHVTNAPVLDESGRVVAIIGVSKDITERKQTEEKLRRSERELRELAESLSREKARLLAAQAVAKVGSWETDLATRSVSWSEQTHRIFETDPAKFSPTHQGFLELVHPEDRVRVNEAFERSLNVPTPCWLEHRIITRSGHHKIVEERWQAFFDKAGRPVRAIGTCQDISDRKRAEEDLRASEQQLHALVGRLNQVREEEAKRIARELHDDLGQNLTALNMELGMLSARLKPSDPALQETAGRMHQLVDRTIESVQKIAGELRLGQLDLLGFTAALEAELTEYERRSGLRCVLSLGPMVPDLAEPQATAVYRIVQEALTNIARHARASRAEIRIREDVGKMVLEIHDDGRGITAEETARRDAYGLLGMRERAEGAGAKLTITGRPGAGTLVTIVLPHPPVTPP